MKEKIKEKLERQVGGIDYQGYRLIRRNFSRINFLKSLYYSYKLLGLKGALKLPVLVGKNVIIKRIGRINFTAGIHPAILTIGVIKLHWESTSETLIFNNNGVVNIGGNVKFHPGSKLFVGPSAILSLGNNVGIGYHSRIIVFHSITIGSEFQLSWEGQIFDTDFHYLQNLETNTYYPRIKPVKIGDNVFIGNRCTVGKGSIIPNGCVISCCTKVSGDFTNQGENVLIVGNPGKVVKQGVQMIESWSDEKERMVSELNNLL